MEEIFHGIFEVVFVKTLKYIGASLRWIISFNKYSFKEILDKDGNTRIGFIVLIIIIGIFLTRSIINNQ